MCLMILTQGGAAVALPITNPGVSELVGSSDQLIGCYPL